MQQQIAVNCLVHVTTNNPQDFTEWLEYHIALGFNLVYVFDSGNRAWLDTLCEKYRENVVLVPRDEWDRKGKVVQVYSARRNRPEWAVCLSDNEFVWLDLERFGNIRRYIEMFSINIGAITAFVKYLSSEKGMKNRVGTQIDCFTHARPNPQGAVAPNEHTPNTGVTFFRITPGVMPLRNPVIPTTNEWCDPFGNALNPGLFNALTTSRQFDPAKYPLRIYKYALRSGAEMEFKSGTKPVGYVVPDQSMQDIRFKLIRVPVNMETEKLFAKDELLPGEEKPTVVPELSEEDKAIMALPIKAAEIDQLILHGRFYEDVVALLNKRGKTFDPNVLQILFEKERKIIIDSAPSYKKLCRLIRDGYDDEIIKKELGLTKTTLGTMRKALLVLDIPEDSEPVVLERAVIEEPQPIENIVATFEAKSPDFTPEQKAETEAMFAEQEKKELERIQKRAARFKKIRENRKNGKKSAKKDDKSAEPVVEQASEPPTVIPEPVVDDTDLMESTNLLDDVDITSLTEK